ncbi:MAG: alpha/beta fold hydrolase [Sandaracinaceae bacterium]|nr:alpha/beta fold hydrolase [Sandaracinaceae bacterium]
MAKVDVGMAAGAAMVRVAARVAPQRTARWVARRFLTTRRRPSRPEEERVLARAERWTLHDEGRALPVYAWGEGEVVLLAHGWNGSAAQLTPFVEPLTARGFRVVAFDAPAHGGAPGRLTHVPEMARVLARLAAETGARLVVGHSAGAAAAALAARRGLALDRAVVIAAPPRFDVWARRFGEALGLPDARMAPFLEELEVLGGCPLADLSLRSNVPSLRGPVLAIFDETDRLVDVGEARAALAGAPGVVWHETSGLGHGRIVADPAVVQRVAGFLEEASFLAALAA